MSRAGITGGVTRDASSAYYAQVTQEVSRLVSLQDRETFSRTFGSFDRTYWGWKFTDFPGARFQEGAYAMAYLFTNPFPGNLLAGNGNVLNWAVAGMRYWRGIQYKDGSFDEAYPFERSLAATAFTSFYVGEAFLLLKDSVQAEERTELERAFKRAGDWLCSNDERHGLLSNHLAAAAAALNTISRITGDEKYEKRSRYFLERIYGRQSKEGWYEEYGGADPGYQTHCTFYLAWIWKNTKDAVLLESLKRSVAFLKHFIHPNGTLGGEYGSRNTEFYFPAGFEILSKAVPDAASTAEFMRRSVADRNMAGLPAMDAYNFMPMLNNYLFAASAATDTAPAEDLPFRAEGEWYFPDAGLYVRSTRSYYAVLGLSKGGVLKVYNKATGELLDSDCGYWAVLSDGRVISSQSLSRTEMWKAGEKGYVIEPAFVLVNRLIQTPGAFIGFRAFTLTLGRLRSASYWIKDFLVRILIKKRSEFPMRLSRHVRFEPDSVFVTDSITLTGKLDLRMVKREPKFSTIHMGSSRYFQPQELEMASAAGGELAAEIKRDGSVKTERRIDAGA